MLHLAWSKEAQSVEVYLQTELMQIDCYKKERKGGNEEFSKKIDANCSTLLHMIQRYYASVSLHV